MLSVLFGLGARGAISAIIGAIADIMAALVRSVAAVISNPMTYVCVIATFVGGYVLGFEMEAKRLREYKAEIIQQQKKEATDAETRIKAAEAARAEAETRIQGLLAIPAAPVAHRVRPGRANANPNQSGEGANLFQGFSPDTDKFR